MKTIDIKGKPYVMVHEKLRYFREQDVYTEWQLVTEITDLNDDRVVMKASIIDTDGRVMATGHAFEYADSTFINKTSFIENCETSAVGRALSNLGIGIEESYASAEEVANAVEQQKDQRPWMKQVQFDKAVRRIQEANPNVVIEEDGNELELSKQEFIDKLRANFRMKKDYWEQLKYEVEFDDILKKNDIQEPST